MYSKRSITLARKINFSIMLTICIVALVFILIQLIYQQHRVGTAILEIETFLQYQVERERQPLGNEIFEGRIRAIKIRLGRMLDVQSIISVSVFDKNGNLIIAQGLFDHQANLAKDEQKRAGAGTVIEQVSLKGENALEYLQGLRVIGELIGYIKIHYSLEDVERERKISFIITGALLAAVIIIMPFLLKYLLSRTVVRPISELRDAINRMQRGELGLQVSVATRDEIGELTESFNKMSEDLAESRRQEELQNRVLRESEEAFRKSEEKYRELVQNANSIILRFDTKGNITFFNDFAQEFFGYTEDEIIGVNVIGRIVPEGDMQGKDLVKMIQDIIRFPEKYKSNENENIKKNGERVWVSWTNKAIHDDQGNITEILAVGNDITEIRRLEAQLQQSNKMDSIGALAGGIAHDFNNLLQAASGYLQLYKIKHQSLIQNHQEYLSQVEVAIERATELVVRLLTFARKTESTFKPTQFNDVIVLGIKLLERIIPKMIGIEADLAQDLMLVNGDPTQLEQIIMNLGINAKDAMPGGGQLVIETKNITLDEYYCKGRLDVTPGEYILLQVSDSGHGMDQETVRHIFEPFFTTKGVGEGTGLGLATVYGIVKRHGGHITCYSEPGLGTTFKVYLHGINVQDFETAARPEPPSEILGGNETILLVDDETAILEMAQDILGANGYTTLAVNSGEKAVDLYREQKKKIDLTILDLGMPGMGGHRCLKALLEINPDADIIIASGYSAKGPMEKTLEDGARGFISKPYRLVDMLKKVREVLDEKME